jgi:hypothetical protein
VPRRENALWGMRTAHKGVVVTTVICIAMVDSPARYFLPKNVGVGDSQATGVLKSIRSDSLSVAPVASHVTFDWSPWWSICVDFIYNPLIVSTQPQCLFPSDVHDGQHGIIQGIPYWTTHEKR